MYKISFKNPNSKIVKTYNDGKVTVVILIGEFSNEFKHLYWNLPREVSDWMDNHPTVKTSEPAYEISVTGKAICSENDTNDPKLGERIAESRAKLSLYKFMRTLLKKVCGIQSKELFGKSQVSIPIDYLDRYSITGQYIRYCNLYDKERIHLQSLI